MNADTTQVTPRECSLRVAVGEHEQCPGASCAFWDDDAAALEQNCTVERLRIPLEVHALARHLLDLRLRLEDARAGAEQRNAPRRFAERPHLNRG